MRTQAGASCMEFRGGVVVHRHAGLGAVAVGGELEAILHVRTHAAHAASRAHACLRPLLCANRQPLD